MVKVIIIGSNVAQHLIAAFQNSKNTGDEIELVQVFSRKANTLVNRLDADLVTTDLAALLDADLYIIAVSDDAINTVAAMLPLKPISGTHLREYGFRCFT
jgi:predicted dehydrogenase